MLSRAEAGCGCGLTLLPESGSCADSLCLPSCSWGSSTDQASAAPPTEYSGNNSGLVTFAKARGGYTRLTMDL